jgi:hypothetical protein
MAGRPEERVCDIRADFFRGVEDYAEAIRLHRQTVHKNPGNALAHCHLGFAQGMIENTAAEIDLLHSRPCGEQRRRERMPRHHLSAIILFTS